MIPELANGTRSVVNDTVTLPRMSVDAYETSCKELQMFVTAVCILLRTFPVFDYPFRGFYEFKRRKEVKQPVTFHESKVDTAEKINH